VRLKFVKVGGFGCLKGWESQDLDPGLVVVYGDNEAGKSTLFNLIKTLFYGWKPVTNNPHVPWDGSAASVEAAIVGDDGEEVTVQRRLRSRVEGKLINGQNSFNIGNNVLDKVAFMPREIFSEVYALALDKLRFPDSNAWQGLQEQLLGGQYASFLKPVSRVMEDLANEANQLWRPDRRGNPLAKRLQERISELKRHREEARENERVLRDKEQELAELNKALADLQEQKVTLLAYLNRSKRLLPVRKKLKQI